MSLSILVTGGAGYLGSIMVPDLLGLGHKVTVLDNFLYKQNSLAPVCRDPNFQVINGDARLAETVAPLLAKSDVVIPLGSRSISWVTASQSASP
ncbi:MAG: NAD-dependent epimerase/dehydratase family protein [Rhodospirillales bacterium]|jgi:nucleoside-diphosphate-sugar epimerase|nr:NAD-dependent epimerase/dehydratase family protein [Rhodospirillales bacterium]